MAANPLRGEVELVAGDVTYKLVFNTNAFVHAEEALRLTTDEILVRVEASRDKADMKLIRALMFAGLQANNPGCHLIEAGEIIDAAGIGASKAAVYGGLAAAFGMAEDGDKKDPPKPKRRRAAPGTG